jgi:hypothetical protein
MAVFGSLISLGKMALFLVSGQLHVRLDTLQAAFSFQAIKLLGQTTSFRRCLNFILLFVFWHVMAL